MHRVWKKLIKFISTRSQLPNTQRNLLLSDTGWSRSSVRSSECSLPGSSIGDDRVSTKSIKFVRAVNQLLHALWNLLSSDTGWSRSSVRSLTEMQRQQGVPEVDQTHRQQTLKDAPTSALVRNNVYNNISHCCLILFTLICNLLATL